MYTGKIYSAFFYLHLDTVIVLRPKHTMLDIGWTRPFQIIG